MSQTHDHGAHAPAQSSGEISEFEILELAVRELATCECLSWRVTLDNLSRAPARR